MTASYLKGVSVLKMPWTYFCLVMVGITAGGGIIALNAGLNSFEAMQIIPLYGRSGESTVGTRAASSSSGASPESCSITK